MHRNKKHLLKLKIIIFKYIYQYNINQIKYLPSNSFISLIKGRKNVLKSFSPGIKKGINKFSFLTLIKGSRLIFIIRNAQQSSVLCLKIWYPSQETVNATSLLSLNKFLSNILYKYYHQKYL